MQQAITAWQQVITAWQISLLRGKCHYCRATGYYCMATGHYCMATGHCCMTKGHYCKATVYLLMCTYILPCEELQGCLVLPSSSYILLVCVHQVCSVPSYHQTCHPSSSCHMLSWPHEEGEVVQQGICWMNIHGWEVQQPG